MIKYLMLFSSIGYMLTSLAEPNHETSHIKFKVGYQHIIRIKETENKHKHITKATKEDIKTYLKQKECKISDSILYGICFSESDFNEKEKNKKSTATGCMQILYPTGKWISEDILHLKTKYNHLDNLHYKYNIDLSIAYLNWLYERHNGNVKKVIFSYRGKKDYAYLKKVLEYSKKI